MELIPYRENGTTGLNAFVPDDQRSKKLVLDWDIRARTKRIK
jgi:hypothetical protein